MSSGFVTEAEIAEARKKRQEEWEKVRTADQPEVCPEEPYDSRTLYDRLKEQKVKKDLEYEESRKFKNLIRGLNSDEVQFLEMVDQNKLNMEKKKMLEEEKELKEFRNRVAILQEEAVNKKILSELKTKNTTKKVSNTASKPSQRSLLSVGIKRKNGEMATTSTATQALQEEPTSTKCKQLKLETSINNIESGNVEQTPNDEISPKPLQYHSSADALDKGVLKCVAILPGLGTYTDSSDSEMSSDSDEDPLSFSIFNKSSIKYDLVGRQVIKKKQCGED